MISRVAAVVSLALLLWALCVTVRRSFADWLFIKGEAGSVREAMRLAPGVAEYASALAEAEPDRSVAILRDALAGNPLDGGVRVELGLAEQRQGDFAGAEANLRAATRLDRGFGPRWALADFYFHRHDAEKFWPAVNAALAVSYGDVSDQFHQCWELTSDGQTILRRAIPDRPRVLRFYLDFLLREKRFDAAPPVAARVLATANREEAVSLLDFCDRMLEQGRGGDALSVWKELEARNWIVESGRGFDWRAAELDGIDIERAPDTWTVRFSGREPESGEILSQYVALTPRRRYSLSLRYTVADIPAESGLLYALYLADGRDLLAGRGLLPGGEGEQSARFEFEAPANIDLGRLVLICRRLPGTIRIDGTLTLEQVAVAPVED